MERIKQGVRKGLIASAGMVVLVAGSIMIPYPGPGWLVVFAGLAILATEFAWARHVLEFARSRYDRWQQWLQHQVWIVRMMVFTFTAALVIVTLWLLNVFGMTADLLHFELPGTHSPFAA